MTAPDPKRQKTARNTLRDLFSNPDNVCVIHYSCESFYNRPDGRSPRITSVALRNLGNAQTRSFSIHQYAEIEDVDFTTITTHYDTLEKTMLDDFFTYIKNLRGIRFLHWNMRDSNYGFQAIEHRFLSLGGEKSKLHVIDDRQKADLSRLLKDIYGLRYIDHPRLEKLLCKNEIVGLDFLSGKAEAKAFEKQEFAELHLSTLRKVDVLANIAVLANDRRLKTNTTWWHLQGGTLLALMKWIGEHPIVTFIGASCGVIGLLIKC